MNRIYLVVGCVMISARAFALGLDECQLLDRVDQPDWQVHVEYVDKARVFGPEDNLSLLTLRGGGGLGYWATDMGDFELHGLFDVTTLAADGGMKLPDQLLTLSFKGVYIWRNTGGISYRTEIDPGYYPDIKKRTSQSFFCPAGFSVIKTFNSQCSALIGVMAYPGMDNLLDPRIGFRYAFSDMVYADLMYPESKVVVTPQPDWDFYAGIRDDRASSVFRDARAYAGMNLPIAEAVRLMLQAGLVFNRSVDYDDSAVDYSVSDALYVSLGFGGTL